jgi:hypothetical protein
MNCNYDCDESPSLSSNDCLMKDVTVLICSGVDGLSIFRSLPILSEHNFLIEIGRNIKIPRDQRLCAICNVLEDEFHFFFECKRNTNNRNILYQYFQNIYSNFLELNHEEKLIKNT